jgi:hypothetical protein
MKRNLKELAFEVLEQAKADLSRDKHLVPVAFVITDNEVSDFALTFDGPQEKQSVYSELVRVAREKNAYAIITINDARLSGGTDCIFLTISGPTLPTQSISVVYETRGNQIVFGEQTETTGDRLNLFKGWAQEHEA